MELATVGIRKLIADTRASELADKMEPKCSAYEAAANLMDRLQIAVCAGLISENDARRAFGLDPR